LSDNVVPLLNAQRTEAGFQIKWQNFTPTKFPLKTHIGIPPVIGDDGIIYGVYETLDLASIDLTPTNANMGWTTEVTVSIFSDRNEATALAGNVTIPNIPRYKSIATTIELRVDP
jgi:hypothetical protein